MTKAQKSFKAMVKNAVVDGSEIANLPINEASIDQQIQILSKLPLYGSLSEGEINEVRSELKSQLIISLDLGDGLVDKNHQKWFWSAKGTLDMKYWERYRQYLLLDKDFSPNVVNKMDDVTDTLTDLLGNPSPSFDNHERFPRKGLIIGDVQSGKTANYTALMCKAADAGYRVIVLLTGTIENLRQQTQERIDEGFVGKTSDALDKYLKGKYVGVGKYDSSIETAVLTTTLSDFKSTSIISNKISLDVLNGVAVFVVKKNPSVLENLVSWIRDNNLTGKQKIKQPLLMIDDEADNAGVNVGKVDPSTINALIREFLSLFEKTSYVGFTATPFANIFIDPGAGDPDNEDLFPKDYIYSLSSPSNYVGARDIFAEDGCKRNMLIRMYDNDNDEKSIANILPCKHKGIVLIDQLPEDLKTAIETFVLANAIEDLDGLENNHRSMLINITRRTQEQDRIAEVVGSYLKNIQNAVRNYATFDVKTALNNKYLRKLYDTYRSVYQNQSDCDWCIKYSWDEIQKVLNAACAPIQVKVFNKDAKDKNIRYKDYPKGIRFIAIGGLSLSRGLTLEGLVVSYFYRNSLMYDTLMQMGRWFGYRPGYEKLCRVFMTEDSILWYRQISEASDELRAEVKKYEESGLTPMDFGLRVRTDPEMLLIVTARNKLRHAKAKEYFISLSGEFIATTAISTSDTSIEQNRIAIKNLIGELLDSGSVISNVGKINNEKFGFRNIDLSVVMDFLKSISVSPINDYFDPRSLLEFMQQYKGPELIKWDIAFASGESQTGVELTNGIVTKSCRRSFSMYRESDIALMAGRRKRLASPEDGMLALDELAIGKVKALAERKGKQNPSVKWYFRSDEFKRNPLLVIYPVELGDLAENDMHDEEKETKLQGKLLYGFGIGIPFLSHGKSKLIKYLLNVVAQNNMLDEMPCDDDDD